MVSTFHRRNENTCRRRASARAAVLLSVIAMAAAAIAVCAAPAGAVVVTISGGRVAGVTPRAGVAATGLAKRLASAGNLSGSTDNLDYHNGPVLHSISPYLIFWDPSSEISSQSRALLARYLADSAHDSGLATNVWAVDRQFTDSTGFADYSQSFTGAQAISDTQPFPARDTTNCPDVDATYYPNCLTDAQVTAEVARLIAADSLPTGTGANAPIYLVVTPPDTNECDGASSCADNTFCAYHSSFSDGGHNVLYAEIPMFFDGASAAQNPKYCQWDNNSAVQEPNGDPADVAIKYLSHELNETITDPLGTGWWSSATDNEDGDNCNFYGSANPGGGSAPNAFLPALGGSAGGGTLYDQLINGDPYYTQTEWSNGDLGCEASPAAHPLSPSFSVSAGPHPASSSVGFDPSASTIGGGDGY